jgi:hypothetical protein
VQSSASRGGECADSDVTRNRNCSVPVSQFAKGKVAVAEQVALSC